MEFKIPHLIITDYADIMRPERKHSKEIDDLNEIWESHDALCKERDVILITGTHTNRLTFTGDAGAESISSDIRKLNHVNKCIALNQTKFDRRFKRMRISCLVERDDDYSSSEECMLLQQLDVGKFYIDSYLA